MDVPWSRLWRAWRGRRLWLELQKRHDIDDGLYALLMPEDDAELNALALAHVDDLVVMRRARGVVVLTTRRDVAEAAAEGCAMIRGVEQLLPGQADDLISFFELNQFSERLLIVSLTRPHGKRVGRLIGRNGVTLEDVLCISLLGLRQWGG